MSELTCQLLPSRRSSRRLVERRKALAEVADRLMIAYGIPTLGNWRDPIREIFYIVLSARTTDRQYRKT